MEYWTTVDEFPAYEVSNQGRVRHREKKKLVIPTMNQQGIYQVGFYDPATKSQVKRSAALLVARTYLDAPHDPNDTPIHLDGDRANLNADNLIWRPRWFAMAYHKQFKKIPWCRITVPIKEEKTGETFSNSLEAAMKYGLLEKHIYHSIVNGRPCIPTLQKFLPIREF